MKSKNRDKLDFLVQILKGGNLDSFKEKRKEELKKHSGKIIFVSHDQNMIWEVCAPMLGWVRDKVKYMNQEQFDMFIKKYDYQAYDNTFENGEFIGEIINGKDPEELKDNEINNR